MNRAAAITKARDLIRKHATGEQSTTDYVADVLGKSDYWRPPSHGAGANGSRPGFAGLGNTGNRALEAAAASGDMKEYRRLREKQRGGK